MTNTILQYLMWAIPSGGIGYAIAWIANRRTRQIEEIKKKHDTYKVMYEDISKLLMKIQEETNEKITKLYKEIEGLSSENERLRRVVNRLSRAVEAIQRCPHYADCPVRDELPVDEADGTVRGNKYDRNGRTVRQPSDGRYDRKETDGGDRAAVGGDAYDTNGQSGSSSGGGGVPRP